MMPAGSINAWKCPDCGQLTSAIHVDEGVTPLMLACRATEGCHGMAVSAGYPRTPFVPAHIIVSIKWEWRKASITQMKRYRRENPGMYGIIGAIGDLELAQRICQLLNEHGSLDSAEVAL